MKKLNIQCLTFIVNNNEKIVCVCIENKNEKYILYSHTGSSFVEYDENLFGKMEFTDDLNITPKKKLKDLKLNVSFSKGKYNLTWNNNPVYYLKNTKNIVYNNNLKLLLDNGNLFNKENVTSIVQEINIVDNILAKTKDSIKDIGEIKIIYNQDKNNEVKLESVVDTTKEETTVVESLESIVNTTKEEDVVVESLETSVVESLESVVDTTKEETVVVESLESVVDTTKEEDVVVESLETFIKSLENKDKLLETIVDTVKEEVYIPESLENKNITYETDKKIEIETEIINDNSQSTPIESLKTEDKVEIINEKSFEIIVNDYDNLNDKLQYIKNIIQTEREDLNKLNNKSSIEQKEQSNPKELNFTNVITDFNNKNSIKTLVFNYQNINYKINYITLNDSVNIDYVNLNNNSTFTIIDNINYSLQLSTENNNYLIQIMNTKYLIKKIKNTLLVTQCSNKKTVLVKNKEYFKLANYDYLLFNNGQLMIPMINKKLYNNQYGTIYNVYVPRV